MEDSVVYELGFHVSPAIAEADVENVVGSIKSAITAEQGSVFAEESPKITPLAYEITLKSDAGTVHFDKAYFGWVKFTLSPENISKIDAFAKANKNVIRFILVKTDRMNTIQFHKTLVRKEEGVEGEEVKKEGGEDVEKQIEELVV